MNPNLHLELAKIQKYRTNHLLHLVLSIITAGFWVPVWLLVTISNANERQKAERRIRKMENQ
jgi:hypothetical protein